MRSIYNKLVATKQVSSLLESLLSGTDSVEITKITGSLGSFIAAALLEEIGKPVLMIVPTPALVEAALDDLTNILGSEKVGFLPPVHLHPYDTSPLATGPRNERVDALLRFGKYKNAVSVTQPEALLERSPGCEWIQNHTRRLEIGLSYSHVALLNELNETGYQREVLVDSQGQYAVRGGLIDVFPYGHEDPVRIEFDEDVIASMRRFNPVSQRSIEMADNIMLLVGEEPQESRSGVLDLLPDGSVVYWHGIEAIRERVDRFHQRAAESNRRRLGSDNGTRELIYRDLEQVQGDAVRLRQVIWSELPLSKDIVVDFAARRPDPYPAGLEHLPTYIKRYTDVDIEVWVATDTKGEKERLDEFFFDSELDQVRTITSSVSGGFVFPQSNIALLTTHELFNRRRLRARHTRFRRQAVQFDRSSLRRGDLVVHAEYGIGRYEGLQMVKVRQQPNECLRIRYQDDTILYVRIEHFGMVEKYIGSESARPTLSRIGTGEWARTKKKTRKALQDIAEELIKLYAKRKVVRGVAFPADTHWQKEMEASFEFDDTPDQVVSTTEVKADLEATHPMDRLLCGDVGFGKTEIAIRAAFKVVQESNQVAVLVPTTVLAQQHHETFRERLAPYPVNIRVLSRFRSRAEQRETIEELKEGKVDIVIGTHRLFSRDVGFRKLGLLIVDEEHRFGVRHKERLKQIKTNVDVLTLTATPIPRTLHMALMGARDTSQINTAPVDRLPIQTEVHPWSEDLIRDAIMREVDRQGQVFFVHNRIKSIHAVKGMLERLVPGLNYAIGHGQMKESELERVMYDFMHNRYDVLVTTMIIESGLDIPRVNTLIVNRADRFGLAQLYQLRGRIGRSNRQAYAYLLTPPRMTMTPEARRRLATLTELTELGSGQKIAMRDLEIRGAGNLLGPEQSGFVNAVGFDLYTRMMEEAVKDIKGEDEKKIKTTEYEDVRVEFDGPALVPANYIDDSDLRYDVYRRLAEAADISTIDRIEEELIDRFGNLPEPTRNLLDVTRLKIMGRLLRCSKIVITKKILVVALILPDNQAECQRYIGRLVSLADPEPVEFRLEDNVELIYRFNSSNKLKQARILLRHLTREGIFQD